MKQYTEFANRRNLTADSGCSDCLYYRGKSKYRRSGCERAFCPSEAERTTTMIMKEVLRCLE
jgi:hypothetical protein